MELHALSPFDYYLILDSRQPPSLVIFTSPACGACKRVVSILQNNHVQVPDLKCYVIEAHQSAGLVEELEIFHLPALFLYAQGELVTQLQCVLQVLSIEASIRQALLEME